MSLDQLHPKGWRASAGYHHSGGEQGLSHQSEPLRGSARDEQIVWATVQTTGMGQIICYRRTQSRLACWIAILGSRNVVCGLPPCLAPVCQGESRHGGLTDPTYERPCEPGRNGWFRKVRQPMKRWRL
jgi:hypothetical protein